MTNTPAKRFGCIGGSITWGNAFIDDGEVERQLDQAQREHDAALRAGDRIAASAARSLFLDITDALKARAKWMRCTDGYRIANTQRAA